MNNSFKITILSLSMMVVPLTIPKAHADGGDGFKQVFKAFFGSEGAKKRSLTCDMDDSDAGEGLLQVVNSFFCHMEKDMGITGATTGVTKVFGTRSVRASVTAGAFTVGGVTYANQAQVWVCSSGCSATTGFSRAINVFFSYNLDKTVNKGDMLFDTGAFGDSIGQSGMHLIYDVGSLTTTQTITAQAAYVQSGTQQRMRMDSSKTGNVLGISGVIVQGSSATTSNSFRFTAQLDTVANTGGVYFEVPSTSASAGAGVASVSLAASADSKTSASACFSRSSDGGDDWNYTATGTSGCAVATFSADSAATVGNYTVTSVLTGSSLWNGMAANPSSL